MSPMNECTLRAPLQQGEPDEDVRGYQPPKIEVLALDCEISSYAPEAPDEDDTPLF